MSAEPARHGPNHAARPAAVIPIHTASRPQRHTPRRRTTAVPSEPALTPEQRLAASIEEIFARHGRSLTDDDTAEDYRIALGAVRSMLQGAREQGVLNDEQHQNLDAMIVGMLNSPTLLT